MGILPQIPPFSHSLLPDIRLLPAPPVRLALPPPRQLLMLPAPKIAGLLSAPVPQIKILSAADYDLFTKLEDIDRLVEQWDQEIEDIMEAGRKKTLCRLEKLHAQQQARREYFESLWQEWE